MFIDQEAEDTFNQNDLGENQSQVKSIYAQSKEIAKSKSSKSNDNEL